MTKRRFTRRELLTLLAPALVLASQVNFHWSGIFSAGNDGFIDLFDGQSLSGWHTNVQKIFHGTGGRWQVENGILTGEQDPPGSGNGGILMTDQKYGDFDFMIDLNPDWGVDSGVFLRTNTKGECFQVYVDYHDHGQIGYISTETTDGKNRMYIRPFYIMGTLDASGDLKCIKTKPDERELAWRPEYLLYHCTAEQWEKAWKIGEWNTMRIRCVGKYPRITTWINNTMIADFDGAISPDPLYKKEQLFETLGREGSIGLQVHGGGNNWTKGAKCRWKNIRIKQL
ncbi:MAG: DUF1080 domain-containing protein [Bacteroidetes bacterium]|nr:DUF1080 domain-containing protein [Bacteroidota bacterium]